MALAYQRLTYSRGKGIYVVRSRALHASHQRLLTNGEDATQGIFGNWGAALDAGYNEETPHNATTFVKANNTLSASDWNNRLQDAQDYMRAPRQYAGLPRVVQKRIFSSNVITPVVVSVLCFIIAVILNPLLFKLSKYIYHRFECEEYINNAQPICMGANQLKVNLGSHQQYLIGIAIDKIFVFIKNLAGL